jgi:hypothetical protein
MSTTTTTTTATATAIKASLPPPVVEYIPTANTTHKLFTRGENHRYDDFRDDLIRDGYAVIKGAIPRERADQYADQFYQFLEDL